MRELSEAEEIARGLQLLVDRCEQVHVRVVDGWDRVDRYLMVDVEPLVPPYGETCPQHLDRVPTDEQVAWLVRRCPSLQEHHVRRLYELGWRGDSHARWVCQPGLSRES